MNNDIDINDDTGNDDDPCHNCGWVDNWVRRVSVDRDNVERSWVECRNCGTTDPASVEVSPS